MLIKQLAASGGVRGDLSPEELHNVVFIGMMLGNMWLSYIESIGHKINEAALEQAVEVIIQHYKTYLLETK